MTGREGIPLSRGHMAPRSKKDGLGRELTQILMESRREQSQPLAADRGWCCPACPLHCPGVLDRGTVSPQHEGS